MQGEDFITLGPIKIHLKNSISDQDTDLAWEGEDGECYCGLVEEDNPPVTLADSWSLGPCHPRGRSR